MNKLFNLNPLIIAALHIPNPDPNNQHYSAAWLEEYVLKNMQVFVSGGIPAVILQDQRPTTTSARPETIALMAGLGKMIRHEFPQTELGIIMKAHDPRAALAVASGCGASFVRIKVFVGAMLKTEGIIQGCGVQANEYRHELGREDIAILADVYDRTGFPVLDVPIEQPSEWALRAGADAIILTGSTYAETLADLARVRKSGVKAPLLSAGGADSENIAELLRYADGIIVSTSLMEDQSTEDALVKWSKEKVAKFMDNARIARK